MHSSSGRLLMQGGMTKPENLESEAQPLRSFHGVLSNLYAKFEAFQETRVK